MLESQNREISAKLEAITSSQKEKDSKRELEKIANKVFMKCFIEVKKLLIS